MNTDEVLSWLREADEERLNRLWRMADHARQKSVGDAVHLRGLVEISNYCTRACEYCGIRAPARIRRYRMTDEEILACSREAVSLGYGTVVLQSGEDPALSRDFIRDLVKRIKDETKLAVTLSLGERSAGDLEAWREAGADRYLLRFETSNEELYARIHPPARKGRPSRMDLLKVIRKLGYEVGSGVMVGIPGQSYSDLARDVEVFRELDLDMIGIGPFIPHPDTPLGSSGGEPADAAEPAEQQAPSGELATYKMIALSRLVCPFANIPSTTALSTLNLEEGRELGLARGANVVMPNLTPPCYRALYEIYPGKSCLQEDPGVVTSRLRERIVKMGRVVGTGRGDSPNRRRRGHAR